jgi:hypothetical protein
MPRILAVALALTLSGCTSLYYKSMEKLGKEKRDILVQRIIDGKKDQEKAREQIKTTMQAFQELTGFKGGDLEKVYNKLNGEYESAEGRANDLSNRIKSIDQVAKDMFREWEKEIGQMRNRELKARSSQMLRDTRTRHAQYIKRMHETEARMKPVIVAFRDQVYFLKHNLNARAIRSLKTTLAKMDKQVETLVVGIEQSMKEADSFIGALTASETES